MPPTMTRDGKRANSRRGKIGDCRILVTAYFVQGIFCSRYILLKTWQNRFDRVFPEQPVAV
jgi:hypothetical protein